MIAQCWASTWYAGAPAAERTETRWINQVWLIALIDGEDTVTFFSEQLHHVITEETI